MTAKILWQDVCPGRIREEIVDDILRVTSFSEDPLNPPPANRVSEGLQVLYTFEQGAGRLIHDVSGVGIPLDLILHEESAASWLPDGGLVIESPTILTSERVATKIIDAVKSSNEITIEAWVRPANVTQSGPARIVALSQDALTCNALLGQATELYEIRLRTTSTTESGKPAVTTPAGSLTEKRTHAVYTRDASGQVRTYLDGVVVHEQILDGDFRNWSEGYRLALANEPEGGREWLGEFHLVAVYDRALRASEVILNYEAGGGVVPEPPPGPLPPDDDPPPLPAGRIYYVSKEGQDSGDGSVGSPWLTIAKANETLKAGEAVYLGEGTYNEIIEPANSGTDGKPIIYMANPANQGEVILAGKPGIAKMVYLDRAHITVEGLHIEWLHANPGTNRWIWVDMLGDNCTLQNCTITRPGDPLQLLNAGYYEFAVYVGGADCTITGCTITNIANGVSVRQGLGFRLLLKNSTITNIGACCVNIFDSGSKIRGFLVDNCVLGPCVKGDAVQFHEGADAGTYSLTNYGAIIRHSILKSCGENAVDMKGAAYIVIEDSYIYGHIGSHDGPLDGWNRNAHQTISVGGERIAGNVIIRNNVIFDSCAGIELQGNDYKIYHNTIIGNNRDYTGSNSTASNPGEPLFAGTKCAQKRSNIAIKNNIFASHNSCEVTLYLTDAGSSYDIDHNLYYNPAGAVLARQRADVFDAYKLAGWKNLLATFDTVSGKEANSLEANPQFASVPNYPTGEPAQYDFRIRATSPARNAGGSLTRTDGSGSNKSVVTVQDVAYFADGFGITGGDQVKVGSNEPVRVIAVDYGRNQLTLASPISWNNRDPVYLGDFEGSAPDIGAFEYGMA